MATGSNGRRGAIGGAVLVALVVALAASAFWAGRPGDTARAQPPAAPAQQEPGQPRGITVSAEGNVEAAPDVAYLTVGFVAENRSVTRAQGVVARRTAAAITRLQRLGIARRDIQTAGYTIGRVRKSPRFAVNATLRVTVRKVDRVGAVLDASTAAGANRVGGITFGIEDRGAAERGARQRAMREANAKAGQLARLGGVTLGTPVRIDETQYFPYAGGYPAADTGVDMLRSEAQTTPIAPGQLRVSVSVTVTYAIR